MESIMDTKIVQTYYIATGRKNGFYTLRCTRDGGMFQTDNYVRTLAVDEDKAVEKAMAYFEAMKQRVGESERFVMLFDSDPAGMTFKRRGKLSVRDSQFL